jgi:hypothetical protein
MADHPDFYIPFSSGTITEQTAAYCVKFNFWGEQSIPASDDYIFTFTISDNYFLYIPVMVTVSPLANKPFWTAVNFAGVEFWLGSAYAVIEAHFAGLSGLQLVNNDQITVYVINLDTATRTFDVNVTGVKIKKPIGY